MYVCRVARKHNPSPSLFIRSITWKSDGSILVAGWKAEEERGDGDAPGCAISTRACFPLKSSPPGNPPTSPSPDPGGKSLRDQNTPASSTSRQTRGVRRQYRIDSRTQFLARTTRFLRENFSRSFFFAFYFSASEFRARFAKERSPTACKKVKIKALETDGERKSFQMCLVRDSNSW